MYRGNNKKEIKKGQLAACADRNGAWLPGSSFIFISLHTRVILVLEVSYRQNGP